MKIEQEKNYEVSLRKRMIEKLEDLKIKLLENEDFPHGKQDVHALIQIDESIDECLNNWYY
jgi:hypothetical protein